MEATLPIWAAVYVWYSMSHTEARCSLNLIWSYSIKVEDGWKKARYTCDKSACGGSQGPRLHTHANSIDQTGSPIFYTLSAVENYLVFSSDVSHLVKPHPTNKISSSVAIRHFMVGGRPKVDLQFQTATLFPFKQRRRVTQSLSACGRNILIKSSCVQLHFKPTIHEPIVSTVVFLMVRVFSSNDKLTT
jgi:hypothetical protein